MNFSSFISLESLSFPVEGHLFIRDTLGKPVIHTFRHKTLRIFNMRILKVFPTYPVTPLDISWKLAGLRQPGQHYPK